MLSSHTGTLPATQFQALASLLRKSAGFESTIVGISMEPTIPNGANIRIRPLITSEYKEGQVVACVVGNSLFAHRIVYCGQGARSAAYILTQGDGWVLCDPPTPKNNILGMITEYSDGVIWRTPATGRLRTPWKNMVSIASFWLIRLSLAIHYEFARRVAGLCLRIGAACKGVSMVISKVKFST